MCAEDLRSEGGDALLAGHADESMFELLLELGASRLVAAAASDYEGSEDMLKDTFGYKPPPGD